MLALLWPTYYQSVELRLHACLQHITPQLFKRARRTTVSSYCLFDLPKNNNLQIVKCSLFWLVEVFLPRTHVNVGLSAACMGVGGAARKEAWRHGGLEARATPTVPHPVLLLGTAPRLFVRSACDFYIISLPKVVSHTFPSSRAPPILRSRLRCCSPPGGRVLGTRC